LDSVVNDRSFKSIALSSNEQKAFANVERYQQEPQIPYNPIIVHSDCFGYMVAWIRAFINDQGRYSTQQEFSAHQGDRIQQGLWGALTASGARAIVTR
jgi:hypothetical protein